MPRKPRESIFPTGHMKEIGDFPFSRGIFGMGMGSFPAPGASQTCWSSGKSGILWEPSSCWAHWVQKSGNSGAAPWERPGMDFPWVGWIFHLFNGFFVDFSWSVFHGFDGFSMDLMHFLVVLPWMIFFHGFNGFSVDDSPWISPWISSWMIFHGFDGFAMDFP